MMQRLFAPTMALFICLALGACSSFSGFVTDNWPTWAGGMPKDVPPRPGAPGYDEFLIQQQGRNPPPGAPGANATAAPAAPISSADKTSVQTVPPANPMPANQGVAQGGLY
jgi:hypothetical protein